MTKEAKFKFTSSESSRLVINQHLSEISTFNLLIQTPLKDKNSKGHNEAPIKISSMKWKIVDTSSNGGSDLDFVSDTHKKNRQKCF